MNYIENQHIKFWVENTILCSEYKSGFEMNLENSKEIYAMRKQISDGINQYFLYDISNLKSMSKDAIDSICMAINLYTEESENYLGKQVNNSQTEQLLLKEQTEMKKASEKSIIIAEDNVINQMLISTILAQEGYKTFIADNGLIAVEEFAKNEYDLILMDLMMPEMNGYEATEFVRTNMQEPKRSIPIIAVTADVTMDVKEKCLNTGINDYISKPYTQKELIDLIRNYIK